jgi:cytochrome c-type protein NapB
MRVLKVAAVGSLLAATALYAVNVSACTGCHGKQFEKKAMGVSKVVKDMSRDEIVAALEGYKKGTYGGSMKGIMAGQVAKLSHADMEAIADLIKNGAKAPKASKQEANANEAKVIDINKEAGDPNLIKKQDLGAKKEISDVQLSYRNTDLMDDQAAPPPVKYDRPAPGSGKRFARAYVNAPPMIPHSVEGLLPITKDNNQCLNCHMPNVAKSMGATPIPPSHFTNYRPETVYKNGELIKEGKVVGPHGELGNTGDIKLAKVKKLDHLYEGRFNCSQCHAPQANVKPLVGNTFQPDLPDERFKAHSNLVDVMNEGVE